MENKAISPAALIALKDALSKIYWYKKDTQSFIKYAIKNEQIVSTIDWNNNIKYESVSQLIDRMSKRPDIYFDDLLALLEAVNDFSDYSHFDRMDKIDSDKRKREARTAVEALRVQCRGYFYSEKEKQKSVKAKEKFNMNLQKTQDYNQKIEAFKLRYYGITALQNSQKRGYELESFLNDLFFFFDLSPRSSFRINGEQIDGAFTHDDNDYLLEAKWQNQLVERADVDVFEMKISRKLKTTLGLFFSANGFVESVVCSEIRFNSIILMDSQDLVQVLENRISLIELVRQKRRHASETGENMYRVNA